ncbi:MAG: hypothetical protein R2856_39800 [Caldilineaceae bacterium]
MSTRMIRTLFLYVSGNGFFVGTQPESAALGWIWATVSMCCGRDLACPRSESADEGAGAARSLIHQSACLPCAGQRFGDCDVRAARRGVVLSRT